MSETDLALVLFVVLVQGMLGWRWFILLVVGLFWVLVRRPLWAASLALWGAF